MSNPYATHNASMVRYEREGYRDDARRSRCTIGQVHCENCGSTSLEDVGFDVLRENDGYTACCNELVAHDPHDCRAHHVAEVWESETTSPASQVPYYGKE